MTKLVKSLWALVLFWLPAFVYWIRIMLWYSSDQEAAGKQHVAWHTLIKHSFRKVQPPQEFSYRHSSLNFVVFQWFLSLKRFPFNHITAYHCEPGLHGAPESMWSPKTVCWFQCYSIGFKRSQTISSRGPFSSSSGAFDHNTADLYPQMEINPVFIIRSMFSFLSWAL